MTHHPSSLLARFFSGLTEHTFQTHLGVVDPPLVDYLSGLLVRFLRNEAVYRVRRLNGRPLHELTAMFVEAEERLGEARREVHRHIGDFALFWAGLYPEALRHSRAGVEWDRYHDYCQQGKRSYFIASTIEAGDDTDAPADILERLSQRFELCAYGLHEVRREWERGDEGDGPKALLIS